MISDNKENNIKIKDAMSVINTAKVAGMVKFGYADEKIKKVILDKTVTDENEYLAEEIEDEIDSLIKESKEELAKEEKTSSVNDYSEYKTSPIDKESENLELEKTGELFKENITKEEFIDEYWNLAIENSEVSDSNYFSELEKLGPEAFFNALDTDGNGALDSDELKDFFGADGDETSVSAEEFNAVFNKALSDLKEDAAELSEEELPLNAQSEDLQATQSAPAQGGGNVQSGGNSGSRNTSSSNNSSGNTNNATVTSANEEKESVEDLIKQREEIEEEADKKISELNDEITELIESADIEAELKSNYTDALKAYEDNQTKIEENNKNIAKYDANIYSLDKKLANLNGEYNSLKTDTSNESINSANAQRKKVLKTEIEKLENQKAEAENKKAELENENKKLEDEASDLKNKVDEAFKALKSDLPLEVKNKISGLEGQISALETEKEQKLKEIDSKIETRKAEEIKEQQEVGETTGKAASNDSDPSDISWWVAQGFDVEKGKALSDWMVNRVNGLKEKFTGNCVGIVREGINAIFYNGETHYTRFGKACNVGRDFLSSDSNFKKISPEGISPSDIPAGAIIIYGPGYSTKNPTCGHGEVSNGQGRGYSDGVTRIKSNIQEIWIPV